MRKLYIFCFYASICISRIMAQDKDNPMQVHGYVKDLQTFSFFNNFDSSSWVQLVHNRINFSYAFSQKWKMRMEARNRVFWGNQVRLNPEFEAQIDAYPGYFDLSKTWVNDGSLLIHSVIDRLQLKYASGKWDITVGRQRINWGMHNIWNPNDIFNAYNFLDFDYEERPGNDAVRIQYYPRQNQSLEWAYKPGKGPDETIAALKYSFNKHNYDWQTIAGLYYRDIVLGFGWAGGIENIGFKGELSYFHPMDRITDSLGALSFSLMGEYTLEPGWYLNISYLYNSRPLEYNSGGIFGGNLSAKSLFPFRHSIYSGFNKSLPPAFQLSTALIFSPTNTSLIIFPVISYSLSSSWDADLTTQWYFAKMRDRYACQGAAIYFRIRWSF